MLYIDENVLSYKALLSAEAPSALAHSWSCSGSRWNVYLCFCRDQLQLSIHSQCLASVHVHLYCLSAAGRETASERCFFNHLMVAVWLYNGITLVSVSDVALR